MDYFFFCESRRVKRALESSLRSRGYAVHAAQRATDRRGWLVAATDPAPVDVSLERSAPELEALADAVGAEYDGWEAAAT